MTRFVTELILNEKGGRVPNYALVSLAAAGAWLLAAQPAPIQPPTAPEVLAETTTGPSPCCRVPAHTSVSLELTQAVGSKISTTRDAFTFRLAEPLTIEGHVVVPAGTPGVGEVVHAAKARAAGKAGELILAARYLDIGGQHMLLRSLSYGPSQGKDNAGAVGTANLAAAALFPMASVLGFLVSGGNIEIPAGARATAQTAVEVTLPPIEQ